MKGKLFLGVAVLVAAGCSSGGANTPVVSEKPVATPVATMTVAATPTSTQAVLDVDIGPAAIHVLATMDYLQGLSDDIVNDKTGLAIYSDLPLIEQAAKDESAWIDNQPAHVGADPTLADAHDWLGLISLDAGLANDNLVNDPSDTSFANVLGKALGSFFAIRSDLEALH